ncbi:hypothetical protein ABPG74_017000 [Tetrahymena malaccensis]
MNFVIAISIFVHLIIQCSAQQGNSVSCSQPCNCSNQNCGTFPGFLWVQGVNTQCSINDCSSAPFPQTGLTDIFCGSCTPFQNAIYANSAGYTCVASTQSCSSTQGWTNSNCQLCNPATPYANASLTGCVNCSSTSGLTDAICAICNPSAPFASGDTTSCVNSSQSCSSSLNVKDSDCAICFPLKPYANIAQTACKSVKCRGRDPKNPGWTDNDCKQCYSPGSKAKKDGSACYNCFATNGMTNDLCQLCFGTGKGAYQYANSLGTCVSVNCSKTSGWNDIDCQACNPATPYSSQSGTVCQSFPSNSSILIQYFISLIIFML